MRIAVLGLLAAGLAACQQPPSPSHIVARDMPAGFACPPDGTRVWYGSDAAESWLGADPRDPSVCIVQTASGLRERRLFGLFPIAPESDQAIRTAAMRLWPLIPGRQAEGVTVRQSMLGQARQFRTHMEVEQPSSFSLAGEPRQAHVIRVQSGFLDGQGSAPVASPRRYLIDMQTGVPLQREVTAVQGVIQARPATVQRFELAGN